MNYGKGWFNALSPSRILSPCMCNTMRMWFKEFYCIFWKWVLRKAYAHLSNERKKNQSEHTVRPCTDRPNIILERFRLINVVAFLWSIFCESIGKEGFCASLKIDFWQNLLFNISPPRARVRFHLTLCRRTEQIYSRIEDGCVLCVFFCSRHGLLGYPSSHLFIFALQLYAMNLIKIFAANLQ